jgi:hypothetical protein
MESPSPSRRLDNPQVSWKTPLDDTDSHKVPGDVPLAALLGVSREVGLDPARLANEPGEVATAVDYPTNMELCLTDIERVVHMRKGAKPRKTKPRKIKTPAKSPVSLAKHVQPELLASFSKDLPTTDLHRRTNVVKPPLSKFKEVIEVTLPKLPFGQHIDYNKADLASAFRRKVRRDWFSINNSKRKPPVEDEFSF